MIYDPRCSPHRPNRRLSQSGHLLSTLNRIIGTGLRPQQSMIDHITVTQNFSRSASLSAPTSDIYKPCEHYVNIYLFVITLFLEFRALGPFCSCNLFHLAVIIVVHLILPLAGHRHEREPLWSHETFYPHHC